MKDLFGYFDEYTLKARFLPACIAGLPLLALIASYFDWNKFLISNVIVGVLIGFLMVFLLSNVARYMGKKVEKNSLVDWKVLPSTELMRHSDNSLNKVKKDGKFPKFYNIKYTTGYQIDKYVKFCCKSY